MLKHKKDKLDQRYESIKYLQKALDLIEGRHSNIPYCCIQGYLEGRTWMNVTNSLSTKDIKKLSKWNYVPCEECFKNDKRNKLKLNGMSVRGQVILAIINSLKEEKE